jgi:hypothetical protein
MFLFQSGGEKGAADPPSNSLCILWEYMPLALFADFAVLYMDKPWRKLRPPQLKHHKKNGSLLLYANNYALL